MRSRLGKSSVLPTSKKIDLMLENICLSPLRALIRIDEFPTAYTVDCILESLRGSELAQHYGSSINRSVVSPSTAFRE